MDEAKLFEDLLTNSERINYSYSEDFDFIREKAKMYIRKFFGNDSHYLKDIESINFLPPIIMSGVDSDYPYYFELGLKQFKRIISVIIEDLKLSSNYPPSTNTTTTIPATIAAPGKRHPLDGQTIQILLASPSDVSSERELLFNSLETKFRRDGYEQQCGKRIIVRGWEELATQSGYGQDIINEQLLSKVDIVLAIFKHKIGTPTIDPATSNERAKSGTAEELLYAINNSLATNPPLGMAYFYSEAPSMSFESVDFQKTLEEWKKLKEFKSQIKFKILYKEFSSQEQLLTIACKDIFDNIKNHFE
jgi:hypothetical protein